LKADYTYTADFDWQASSQSYVESVGNVIQNANTHTFGTDIDFNKFYKIVGADKLFSTKKIIPSKKDPKLPVAPKTVAAKKNKSIGYKIGQGFYDVVTSIKKARINYSENNGTFLPGYVPEIGFLGRDNYSGGLAPTFGFVFGSQIEMKMTLIITKHIAKLTTINWML
jgi:cell surface protein SprA